MTRALSFLFERSENGRAFYILYYGGGCKMMRLELTYEDAEKLATAYRYIHSSIEKIEKYHRDRDLPGKPSSALLEARRLIGEVLHGE